jgi:hypothetical protein
LIFIIRCSKFDIQILFHIAQNLSSKVLIVLAFGKQSHNRLNNRACLVADRQD